MGWKPTKTLASAKNSAHQSIFDTMSGVQNGDAGKVAKGVANVYTLGAAHEVENAAKAAGGSISNAYHTSIVDPLKKAGADVKNALGKLGAGGGPNGSSIPMIPVGGSGPGGGGGAGSVAPKLSASNVVLAAPTAATIDTTPQGQFRQNQVDLINALSAKALGQPGATYQADIAAQQAREQGNAALFAQLASARGGANPLAARNAAMSASNLSAQVGRDAAQARLAEQVQAQGLMGELAGAGRGQDISLATSQADLAQQAALAGYQGGIEQMKAQGALDQQYAELQARYQAMGLDAQKANQLAAIEIEKIKAGAYANKQNMMGGLAQGAAGILASFVGGSGSQTPDTAAPTYSTPAYQNDYDSSNYDSAYDEVGPQTGDY